MEQIGKIAQAYPGTVEKQVPEEGFPGSGCKFFERKKDAEQRKITEKGIPDYGWKRHQTVLQIFSAGPAGM